MRIGRNRPAFVALGLLLGTLATTAVQATGNLEVVTLSGTAIGNRVWHNNSIPVTWRFHDPTTITGCYSSATAPPETLQPASAAGFTAWLNNPDSRISFNYSGLTTVRDAGNEGVNVITFCDSTVLSSNQGFLASTPTTALTQQRTVAAGGGCPAGQGLLDINGPPPPDGFCFPVGTYPAGTIIDADIRFNSFGTLEEDFSTDNTTPGSFDVQAIVTHEQGHFHGLSHDPIPEAVMFPFIDDVPASDNLGQRVLKRSDLATSAHYYPEASHGSSYGSITGFISLDGADADGVHVVAIDPITLLGVTGRFSISRFEDPNALGTEGPDFAANGGGFYRIDGLPPSSYYVYVEYFNNSEFISQRLMNRYNTTIANSNVATGSAQTPGALGFLPALTEFYNSVDSGHGGDGVNPGTAVDNSDQATLVAVTAGAVTSGIDIAINIEPVNGQSAANRQNPTTRSVIPNDNIQGTDVITAFALFDGGTYAIRYPASLLPTPPYNIAEGLWSRGGKNTADIPAMLAFEDPANPGFPALSDPVVPSAGRVLTGGPNGKTAAGDFIDPRDQWNVTINEPRDVYVIMRQPPTPVGTTFITQAFFVLLAQTVTDQARVKRTLLTEDSGTTWEDLGDGVGQDADVLYDLILEADPPVMITSANPNSLEEGQTAEVNINGVGFKNGATVTFGSGITVNSVSFISAQQLRCNITLAFTGATANRGVNVKVTNPGVVFPNVSRVFTARPLADSDGDGVADPSDCAPSDPALKHPATEVANLTVAEQGLFSEISWDSQDTLNGSATSYDVVAGLAANLRPSNGYAMATCAVNNHPDTPFLDSTTVGVGEIRYWLVRAGNGCNVGSGTYGDSNIVPDPRDALDAGAPCP